MRSRTPRLSMTSVMRRWLPSREPRPMRRGAPESQVTRPLFSRPWRSMATSKRRSRNSLRKRRTARHRVRNRRSCHSRSHSALGQASTSSTAGSGATRGPRPGSASQAMWASGQAAFSAPAMGEAKTMSPMAEVRTTRMRGAMAGSAAPGRRAGELVAEGFDILPVDLGYPVARLGVVVLRVVTEGVPLRPPAQGDALEVAHDLARLAPQHREHRVLLQGFIGVGELARRQSDGLADHVEIRLEVLEAPHEVHQAASVLVQELVLGGDMAIVVGPPGLGHVLEDEGLEVVAMGVAPVFVEGHQAVPGVTDEAELVVGRELFRRDVACGEVFDGLEVGEARRAEAGITVLGQQQAVPFGFRQAQVFHEIGLDALAGRLRHVHEQASVWMADHASSPLPLDSRGMPSSRSVMSASKANIRVSTWDRR